LIVDHVALIGEREVRGDEPGGATEFAVTFGDGPQGGAVVQSRYRAGRLVSKADSGELETAAL